MGVPILINVQFKWLNIITLAKRSQTIQQNGINNEDHDGAPLDWLHKSGALASIDILGHASWVEIKIDVGFWSDMQREAGL